MITSRLDDVLDRTVVAGFTNVGYRIRSRGWTATELPRMQGKVVLVTGAVVGPFLLTNLLIALLRENALARIINVSSGGMYTQKLRLMTCRASTGGSTGRPCTREPSVRR